MSTPETWPQKRIGPVLHKHTYILHHGFKRGSFFGGGKQVLTIPGFTGRALLLRPHGAAVHRVLEDLLSHSS